MIRRHTRKVRALSSEVITAQVWKTLKRAAIGLFARHLETPLQPYFHLYNQYAPRHLGPIPIAKPKEHYPIELFQERPIDRRGSDGYSTPAFGCLGLGSR